MVAAKWNWDAAFMLRHFGWKVLAATATNALFAFVVLRKELAAFTAVAPRPQRRARPPGWLSAIHLAFLGLIVLSLHHPALFVGAFLLFMGVTQATREFQDSVRVKESLLVGFFLAGLVVLGGLQSWWLAPLIARLDSVFLFLGTTALTAFTDNAALTYLGSQIPNVTHEFQYALVAGAIAGGGLTVIANAPNPAGYSILQTAFGSSGIRPLKLLIAAAVPTLVAMFFLWAFGT